MIYGKEKLKFDEILEEKMDLRKITEELIKFRTETGNLSEIERCMRYLQQVAKKIGAEVEYYQKDKLAPVLLVSNGEKQDFDVLAVGHIDVVPATDNMFIPYVQDGKMFGRGTLDMKSFAVVALNTLEYVISNHLPIKFGVLLSSDEEKGSFGLEAFLEDNPHLKSKVVFDVDVAGDITKMVVRCKSPVFVKLTAEGKEAHGSTPWEGIDANERLMQVWQNIRQIYPYYSKDGVKPENTWIDTVHFAKIEGGDVANVISNHAEALLDFRLTEKSTLAGLEENLKKSLVNGVEYKIVSSGRPVVMDENNPYISRYKEMAGDFLGTKVEYEYIGGATDSRAFAERGSIVIMHSGSGDGMHASGEYVIWESVEQLAQIQQKFVDWYVTNK